MTDFSIRNVMMVFSLGSGDNLGRSKNVTEPIPKFINRFRKPHVTPEKYREYKSSNDKRQRFLKGVAGWFMRGGVEKGKRNRNSIMASTLITLDIDYADPEFVELLLAGKILDGYKIVAHSTRSHTPEKPRLRVMIFLSRKVDRDRYQAASRIVAQLADPEMKWVDKVSFRPAQMMYMPTVSSDMEKHYIFYEQEGDLLDPEDVITNWELLNGPATDIGNLPRAQGEDKLRESQEQAEDPLEKKGPVGDFCRAYSITELVVGKDGEPGILADVYEPTEWSQGSISRMTYLGGSTSNGAVVYDDKYIFSHHGTDPGQETLMNAYDAVRIHKFGKEDKDLDDDTQMKDRPSVKKMTEFLRDDPHFRIAQAESRYDLEDMLADDDVEYEIDDERPDDADLLEGMDEEEEAEIEDLIGQPVETPWSKRKSRQMTRKQWAAVPPKRWIAKKLELSDDGIIKTTMHNIAYIVLYDPRLFRKVAFNLFSKSVVMVGDFKSKMELIPSFKCEDKENGDDWQEINDMIIRTIIEAPSGQGNSGYGIKVGKEMVHDAVRVAANRNAFHPILEYLDDLRDKRPMGKPDLIERLFIDYYGCPDTRYYRDMSRLILIASVARVEEPGCKFDYAIVIEGAQGTRKSSSISTLYGGQYFGEIDGDLGNLQKTAEQIAGKWALELPELSAMHKSEANDTKAFMSRQHDDVRMVYDRNKSKFPRQCVIWGTTNDQQYLRDITGGRRYLIVESLDNMIDTTGIARDRDAIWQAGARGYDQLREAQPEGPLPLYLQGESEAEAKRLQERARRTEAWETWMETVLDWMDEEHHLQSFLAQNNFDSEDALNETYMGYHLNSIVCRVAVTQEQALREALGQHNSAPSGVQPDMIWKRVKAELEAMGWETKKCRVAGVQRRWLLRADITEVERTQGFRVLSSAEAHGIGYGQVDDPDIRDLI